MSSSAPAKKKAGMTLGSFNCPLKFFAHAMLSHRCFGMYRLCWPKIYSITLPAPILGPPCRRGLKSFGWQKVFRSNKMEAGPTHARPCPGHDCQGL